MCEANLSKEQLLVALDSDFGSGGDSELDMPPAPSSHCQVFICRGHDP